MHLSFEFFPPKSDAGLAQLTETARELAVWKPKFVSVTCGAGGSAIDGTFQVVKHIREQTGLAVVPHMTFLRQSRSYLEDILKAYKKLGITQVLALRGDPAAFGDQPETIPSHDVYVNTIDFVAVLKNLYGMEPIIAAYPDVHPLAGSPQQDMEHLKRKVDAGAKRAITQFFFDADTFLRFRDRVRAADIDVTLTPGILPIHNWAQASKFAGTCGAKIPDGFAERFERWQSNEAALLNEGVTHAVALCERLRSAGVYDFHFYTLNRSAIAPEVCSHLGFSRAEAPTPLAH